MSYDRDGPHPTGTGFAEQLTEAAVAAVFAARKGGATQEDLDAFNILPEELEAEGWVLAKPGPPAPGTPVATTMSEAQIAAEIAEGRDPWARGRGGEDPDFDKVPPASHLLAALALRDLVDGPDRLRRLFEPGHIAQLICPSAAIREIIADLSPDILRSWCKLVPGEGPKRDLECRLLKPSPESERARSKTTKTLERRIADCLQDRCGTLAVTARESELPPAVRTLCGRQVNWSGPTTEMILDILRWTHSATRQIAEDALRAQLPEEQELRRLEPVQLDAAFLASSTLAVADRLAGIVQAQRASIAVTLDHLKGMDGVRNRLDRMRLDLEDWRRGCVPWSEVSASAVLYGPPGTGKTTLAKALAGSAGIPLVATSYSDCQKAGHQGDMLAALDRAFTEAAAKAPAVLFIDELDSFSERGAKGKNDDYLRGVVNGLLEQINHARDVEGLILLGATNDLDIIDPAIIRSGRFDLKLEVPRPDRAGLELILAGKLGTVRAAQVDLGPVSERLVGQSGATAEAVVRDALGQARAERTPLAQAHLEAAADAVAPAVDPAVMRRVAVHEAGHVLVTLLSPLPVPRAVRLTTRGGETEQSELPFLTPELAKARLRVLLAGRAAEVCLYGTPTSGAGLGADSDLAKATDLALAIERQWGFGASGLAWSPTAVKDLRILPPAVGRRVEGHLQRAQTEAADLLRQKMAALLGLSQQLLRVRELDRAGLEGIQRKLQEEHNAGAEVVSLRSAVP